jgi:hypothetical protein
MLAANSKIHESFTLQNSPKLPLFVLLWGQKAKVRVSLFPLSFHQQNITENKPAPGVGGLAL